MTEEGAKKQLLDMEDLEQVEDTFLDENEDDTSFSSSQNLYSLYRFPNENPTSVRFKGKKLCKIS